MKCDKIAIIASIQAEMEVFGKLVKDRINNKEIFMAVGGIGKSAAAAITQKVISEEKPDILIYIGLAGALDDNLKLGDIAITTNAVDAEMDARGFDPGLLLGQYPFTYERLLTTDSRLVKLAFNAPIDAGKIDAYTACTSIFMNSKKKHEFKNKILHQLDAEIDGQTRSPNVIDMESTGFLTAAKHNDMPCLILRAVSNETQGDVAKDYIDSLFDRVKEYFTIVEHIIKNIDSV